MQGNESVARLLIDKGAVVNASDEDGWTPLGWALRMRHEAVGKLLIDRGADINAENRRDVRKLYIPQ